MSNAIRFWERGRIAYNLVLSAIVAIYFALGLPQSRTRLDWNLGQAVFVLAVGANVLFCAAYIPDLLAQMSGFREDWRRYRWIVLLVGTAVAAIFTRFISIGMFTA